VPDAAWTKAQQRMLQVTAVGQADGLPWFAIASSEPDRDAVRLARRISRRGRAAIVLALDCATRRLVVAAAFGRLPHLELNLPDPDPESVSSLARLAGGSGAGPIAFAARAADALSTEPVGRRFFRQFRSTLEHMAEELPCQMQGGDRHGFALLQLTRILFLYFIQTKGWLAGRERFLAEEVDRCVARGRRIHRDLLRPLFFGTLNRPRAERSRLAVQFGRIPFLNGGLFELHPLERRCGTDIPNVVWCAAFDQLFERFHFTVSERKPRGSVAPDMLGRVFEGVMAPDIRRASGTFYTPSSLVERILDAALIALLAKRLKCSEAQAQCRLSDQDSAAADALSDITLLDPAAGSGAFLLCALERLSGLGPPGYNGSARKRRVLQYNLFGVDRNSVAVRLAELRLWLAVIADEPADHPEHVSPLPNLDCLIRQGDSLFDPVGLELAGSTQQPVRADASELSRFRREVVEASGAAKRPLERRLRRAEAQMFARLLNEAEVRQRAGVAECLSQARANDLFGRRRGLDRELAAKLDELRAGLKRLRHARHRLAREGEIPWFHYQSHFADVFARGGFDVVLGNPPWLRSEAMEPDLRRQLTSRYRWWRGTRGTYGNSPDLAVAFLERALELTTNDGIVAMLVPAKIATASYGTNARHALASTATLHTVADLTGRTDADFDATVYPLALVASKSVPSSGHRVRTSLDLTRRDTIRQTELRGGGPWILAGQSVRQIAARLAADHPSLSEFITCHSGVKTGLNQIFLNPPADIEPEVLRWAVRGRDLKAFQWHRKVRLLWTHTAGGVPALHLPPRATAYLRAHQAALCSRRDFRNGVWWAVFRAVPALAPYRVVWADLSRRLTAIALTTEADRECIPLNSCYVAPTATALRAEAMAAWLNSSWIRALGRLGAVPAAGGFARHNARIVAGLPLALAALDDPDLAQLADEGRSGEEIQGQLDALVAGHLALSSADQRILRESLDRTTRDRR
ncbi:MAG TPA: N-6 DNA methylase, partial [Gemmatimonadales bacterium]|nr:N-6 DNA methylase [Gemmatimonadales bacterium]